MRSLKLHYVRADNILCFGPEGIELHFTDHGQVVQIVGINYDNPGTDEEPASNAAGKSSIQELLSIGLYGRTVKDPTKNKGGQIINCLAKKGSIEIQWDDFRILRTFTKKKTGGVTASLRLWKSPDKIWDADSEVTRTLTQSDIEKDIGLTHHAFCNVVVFDDSNTYSFLEADTPTKRNIVENLLDLDQYRIYHENSKAVLKELKKKIDDLAKDYARLLNEIESYTHRITAVKSQEEVWRATKNRELIALEVKIKKKQDDLGGSDAGTRLSIWQKAQDSIVILTAEIAEQDTKRQRVEEAIKQAKDKADAARNERNGLKELRAEHTASMTRISASIERALKLIDNLESLEEGTTCPLCRGSIHRLNHAHVIDETKGEIEKLRKSLSLEQDAANQYHEQIEKKTASIANIEQKILGAKEKVAIIEASTLSNRKELLRSSAIPKPEGNIAEQLLEAEIIELKKQLKDKKEECDGESPYKEIVAQSVTEQRQKEVERDEKTKELQEAESEVPYYQFWLEAFGDNGIRKYVIDGIIPALNSRVAYWLQILIDNKIEVVFDNTLEETITRSGNPAGYHGTSKGERRRINLAVSQAFAYVMMLNSGTCPSIVFLDEITGGGIDRAGIPGVYNMIFELAKERQVFVTTHNETLMSMLQGCETLTIKKRNDITVLAS